MNYQRWLSVKTLLGLLMAAALFQNVACTGYIVPPSPPPLGGTKRDLPCPTMIPDQDTSMCPRLKNITLTCGGDGMLHTSVSGSGNNDPILLRARLDDGSMFSAVFVVFNCQDGPREGVTFGVTYTGQVSQRPTDPAPCISQSKVFYSQFQFGNPVNAVFEDLAKGEMHKQLDQSAINGFADSLGLARPTMPRCSFWRQMP